MDRPPGLPPPARGWLPRFFVLFLIVAATGGLFAALFLEIDHAARVERVALRQQARLDLNEEVLGYSLKRFATDALFLASLVSAQLPPPPGLELEISAALRDLLLSFARGRGDYLQVRLLSLHGRELMRVNRDSNAFRVVPDRDLQDKSGRPYFRDCVGQPPGQVTFSGPELNQEHGVVEQPPKPVLRVCTVVTSLAGKPLALLVLNFPAAPFLDGLRGRDRTAPDQLWITDARGSWARGPREALEWGADFGFPAGSRVEEWEGGAVMTALATPAGAMRIPSGWVAVRRVDPAALVAIPPAGIPVLARATSAWTMVSFAPMASAASPLAPWAAAGYAAYLLLGALLSAGIARLGAARERAAALQSAQAARLRDFLDSSGDLVHSVDRERRFVYVNRAWERTLGWSRAEAAAMRLEDILAPESREHCRRVFEQVMAGAPAKEVEAVFVSRDGRRVEVVGSVTPRDEVEGRLTRAFFRDVTAERAARAALAESELRFRRIVEEGLALVCQHDLAGRLEHVNPAAATALEYTPAELEGRRLADLVPAENRPALERYLASWRDHEVIEGDLHILTRGGDRRIWHYRNRRLGGGEGAYVLGVALDVTDQRRAQETLAEIATRDFLTGLPNRRGFDQQFARLHALADRHRAQGDPTGAALAVGILDLDGFKEVNDRFGHAAGDALLRAVGEELARVVRRTDLVARLGGDEFALLLPESGDTAALERLAEKVVAAVRTATQSAVPQVEVTGSLGLARLTARGQPAAELMQVADQALYAAKRAGRDRFHIAAG